MDATWRQELPARPWEALPPGMAAGWRESLPEVSDEIIAVLRAGVPAYARPLEGAFGRGIRIGVERALARFVDLLEGREDARDEGDREVYRRLGVGEARAGRGLDSLLAAYRLGARVAWRWAADAARADGYEADVLALLAESIFAYIDEISADSAEGYSAERSAAAGETARRRRVLVALLAQWPPGDRAAIEAAARDAGWELPARLAAAAWREQEDGTGTGAPLPFGTVAAPLEDEWCAFVPDADAPGRAREIAAALRGRRAALGPVVDWECAGVSAQRALAAARTLGADGGEVVVADEHLPELLLTGDPELVDDLAARALAPLDGLAAGARERLAATLLAWLDHQGHVPGAAGALYVHPQTVRYRLAQLRELFGDRLEDPDARFELLLALRGAGSTSASRRSRNARSDGFEASSSARR